MASRFLILFTTLLFAFTTQAQPGSGQGGGMRMMNPEARVQELITALEITPQQEPAFREAMAKIARQQGTAMQGMRQGGAGAGAGAGNGNNAAAHDHSGAGAGTAADGHDHSDNGAVAGAGAAAHDHGGNGAGAGAQAGAGAGGQGMARRAEMQAQTEAELAPILTGAQMAKFRELEAARMEEMRQRMMQRQQ